MKTYNQIDYIRCPKCGKTCLSVAPYDEEYRITCAECDFTSDTHLSDCGEVLIEFMDEEYAKKCMKYAEEDKLAAIKADALEHCKEVLGDSPNLDKLIEYLGKVSKIDSFTYSTNVNVNKDILQLALFYLEKYKEVAPNDK